MVSCFGLLLLQDSSEEYNRKMESISYRSTHKIEFTLARLSDAQTISIMSRELIEEGLTWSWKTQKVIRHIFASEVVALVALDQSCLVGFAIMEFFEDHSHLNLLAVKPSHQRIRIGQDLLHWLEKTAVTAGITDIYLEVRATNRVAKQFYRSLGYTEMMRIPRYYEGRECALRMIHDLKKESWDV